MQYNILINQRAVVDNGLADKLDLFDLALFDYIYHFFNSKSKKKITFIANGKEYVEIRLSLINENMPLLAMKSRSTFISRMKKLVDAKLLERYENNSKENRSGYRQGDNFSIFVLEKEEEEKRDEHPAQENGQGCTDNHTGGVREIEHNHNTKEYNKEERDKSLSKKDELFEECWKAYGRKGNKQEAIQQWNKLTEKEKMLAKQHIGFYVSSQSDVKYQKDFQRYLGKKTFTNVIYKGSMLLFDPETQVDDGLYHPQVDGFTMFWSEQDKCYITKKYAIEDILDGYNDDNRPHGARVLKSTVFYKWDSKKKQWVEEQNFNE